ncbi:unnamed protein product [Schistocephalus solidus]|uniref:BTB_2 domain-containing protein n=1 Tax=Schistocephalus solidus TaxID=70667 RepID=A0A183TJX1_SCHSO|nr:unnamed protein product [Schistocephalus solidus]
MLNRINMISSIIELNVGGTYFTASVRTLTAEKGSKLEQWFVQNPQKIMQRDCMGRYFIDRRGDMFEYVLDYLRLLTYSENGNEERLRMEADYYGLEGLLKEMDSRAPVSPCTITLSYRGMIQAARDNLADVQFRKIMRILISGKSSVCREVFGSTLNESRAPDCGPEVDRYTSRYYLTHSALEMAFDKLLEAGFNLVGCCGEASTTNSTQKVKPTADVDEGRYQFFHEFYFVR